MVLLAQVLWYQTLLVICLSIHTNFQAHQNLFIGKTLLAKAVANQTSATFLRVVGSELIQKYLGDGPKLVRELFRVAEEHAPSIVFIDEIDAIGTKRYGSVITWFSSMTWYWKGMQGNEEKMLSFVQQLFMVF